MEPVTQIKPEQPRDMKIWTSKEAQRLLKEFYDDGHRVVDIARELNRLGYTQQNGGPIRDAEVSTIAHRLGCAKRALKRFKKTRPYTKRTDKPVELAKATVAAPRIGSDIDTVITIASSNLPDAMKREVIRAMMEIK